MTEDKIEELEKEKTPKRHEIECPECYETIDVEDYFQTGWNNGYLEGNKVGRKETLAEVEKMCKGCNFPEGCPIKQKLQKMKK